MSKQASATVVPTFDDVDDMEMWIDENVNNGKAANYLINMRVREFNARFAGKTASEVEEYGIACTS